MSSKLPVVLSVTAILVISIAVSAIPANALIQRDYSFLNDNRVTVSTGNTKVCGDHLCAPGEWDKLQAQLSAAQMGNQTGRNATSTTVQPITNPTSGTSSLCTMVKSALASANADPTITKNVLSQLGC